MEENDAVEGIADARFEERLKSHRYAQAYARTARHTLNCWRCQINDQAGRIAELEAALRPFADMADKIDDGQEECEKVHVYMPLGVFVSARNAFPKPGEAEAVNAILSANPGGGGVGT